MKAARDLLYDSEASLRLVDRAIGELSPEAPRDEAGVTPLRQHLEQSNAAGGDQVDDLLDDYANTAAIVVRFCQSAGMLDSGVVGSLRPTPSGLRAVSARTAAATAAILDGVARAITLVDAMDGRQGATDEARHAISASLREELHLLTDHLQHQDIAAKKLDDIETLFGDLRRRVAQVVSIFSPPSGAAAAAHADNDSLAAYADAPSFQGVH
ncbi:MAG: hypothetical protein ABI085_16915 [Gemmatimonadaceae bacterium]